MPSARKLSWEEQAKNLELRATECKQKAQRKFIDCVLDKNPHVLNEIVAKIHALGFSEESAAQTPNAKSLQRAATDNRKSSKTKPAIADRDEDPAVVLTPYHRLDACSVAFLIDNVLAHCEPGAMSQPNLKRLMARGRAAQNREVLLELVQFSTGLLPDTALSGKLATLQSFKHFCVERHLARGRRTRDLQLPPTWQTDGVYRIGKISEEFIEVKHGFSEFAILISRRNAPAVEKESDYTLLYNFSELRAALANSHDQEKVVLLYPLFPNAGPTPASTLSLQDDQTALPPKKKICLAIGDGQTAGSASASPCGLDTANNVAGELDPAMGGASKQEDEECEALALGDGSKTVETVDLQVPSPTSEAESNTT